MKKEERAHIARSFEEIMSVCKTTRELNLMIELAEKLEFRVITNEEALRVTEAARQAMNRIFGV